VITQIFKENRLAKGKFIGLGRQLNLHDITCAAYLLAGADAIDLTSCE
jgi:poly(3-hydroxyalkanoate) synthetase